jgi:hypothetical protein
MGDCWIFMIQAIGRVALTTVVVVAIAIGSATALIAGPQGNDPPGSEDQMEQGGQTDSGGNLSEQLDRSKGVIHPPPTGDAEIETTVPNPDSGTLKVIPPPGTPGGDESVEPK